MPALPAIMREIGEAGLEIADFEDLRPHYVRTLALWLERLKAHERAAVAYVGPNATASGGRSWRHGLCLRGRLAVGRANRCL
jgi:cyclopropane fatty-acyl-phospholipid synthase-like methyltransferase